MKTNRLNLDFSIEETTARNEFVKKYMSEIDFELTPDECNQIADYVLYGKDEDGKNAVQRHEIEIKTKSKVWDRKNTDSLDELRESPAFNEAAIFALNNQLARPKVIREVFCRDDVEKFVPVEERQEFYDLFKRIDYFDLLTGFYDLYNGKRDTMPREELLGRFTPQELEDIKERARDLSQYQYLKGKHFLVDLRRDQFTRMSAYKKPFIKKDYRLYLPEPDKYFGSDIPVLPLGLKGNSPIFLEEDELVKLVNGDNLEGVSSAIWENRRAAENYSVVFDFREMEHVYNLILQYGDIIYSPEYVEVESTLSQLIDTLEFYIEFAGLDDLQKEILNMKIKKVHNPEIAEYINGKYGTSYTSNYISTIFRQKIIVKIINAVKYHERVVENLFFEENFKRCNTCGRLLLIDEHNFVKKTRAQDGFANRCKCCDRVDREQRRIK